MSLASASQWFLKARLESDVSSQVPTPRNKSKELLMLLLKLADNKESFHDEI